jgi:ferredoxin, 2Fe-2S
MPKITFLPADVMVDILPQLTLREAVHMADLAVQDRCGGNGACGSCSVKIMTGEVTAKTAAEEAVFYLADNERLSCQCRALSDVTVLIE